MVLSAWRGWQQAELHAAGIQGKGWTFTDGRGEPIHPHAISQTFERIARRAGVQVIRLHDLRHPTARCEEDRMLRAVLVGMLRVPDR